VFPAILFFAAGGIGRYDKRSAPMYNTLFHVFPAFTAATEIPDASILFELRNRIVTPRERHTASGAQESSPADKISTLLPPSAFSFHIHGAAGRERL